MRFPSLSVLALALPALAATPPALLNYQGVLRDAAERPRSGAHDMTFRFWSAASGGDEILVDRHLATNGQAVVVEGGLFDVELGGGQVADGAGAGTYTALDAVFRDHAAVWLEIVVNGETLSPRTRVVAAAYALNAGNFGGKAPGEYVDLSSAEQAKAGQLAVGTSTPSAGVYGLEGHGVDAGGYFRDSSPGSQVETFIATGNYALQGYGQGYIENRASGAQAFLAWGDYGVRGLGATTGAYFDDTDQSGYAWVARGDRGIDGYGDEAGGYFADNQGTGSVYAGYGGWGVYATGDTAGGYFADQAQSGRAYLGYTDWGIYGTGAGAGAYFTETDSTARAYLASAGRGVWAQKGSGGEAAGRFESTEATVTVASSLYGVDVLHSGTYAGQFAHTNGVYARLATSGGYGVFAYGSDAGGYFHDGVHYGKIGFEHSSGSVYKILGDGTVAFSQNHPHDAGQSIIYAAPESSEVAVYTRGTARLAGGVARIALDETFALVANPDVGLTAHLTPRGACPSLHVEAVSSRELTARCDEPGAADLVVDYMVWGLRLGFEMHAPVQPKERESFLPDPAAFEQFYAAQPALRRHAALERFGSMRAALGEAAPLDLTASRELRALVDRERDERLARQRARDAAEPPVDAAPADVPVDAPGDAVTSVTPLPAGPGLLVVPAAGALQPGDVVALDAALAGAVRLTLAENDLAVAGCVLPVPEGAWVPSGQVVLGTAGIAHCRADATRAPIAVGDRLVAAPTPGHAMRAAGPAPGAVLGKAIDPLPAGTGLIRVLVTLQ
ncbi:MAG: hypothetical protein KBD01_03205 [Acidobacteria bacterium]|nr:hypothetical protein [Acidobacteriota bacterium]